MAGMSGHDKEADENEEGTALDEGLVLYNNRKGACDCHSVTVTLLP